MMKGGFVVFKGPLNDNQGNQVVAAGQNFGETATELEVDRLPDRRRHRLDLLSRGHGR